MEIRPLSAVLLVLTLAGRNATRRSGRRAA